MATQIRCALSWFFLALAPTGVLGTAQEGPPSSDSDARIEFYKGRLGGAGTYPAYARLGAAYLQKARETGRLSYHDDAERYLLRSLDFQRNYEALRWLAVLRLEQHQFREALSYAQEAVETLPADLEAKGTLFDVYLALGDSKKAAAVAEAMLDGQPRFASYARVASLRLYQGELEGAVEAMELACADAEAKGLRSETRSWCQVRLGSLYLARCQADRAEAAYQRAFAHLPHYYLGLEHLAELRAGQGKAAEAIALFRTLLKRNAHLDYRVALAQLYDSEGDREAAERERQQALVELRRSVGEGSRLYLRILALLLLTYDESAEEGLHWAQADWENRQDAYAADTLAWAYYRNGRDPEAVDAIEAALRSGLRDGGVLLHAALIHFRVGQHPSARAFLEQALACPLTLSLADRTHAEKLWADLAGP